jgi:glycosyltransferase involved in cell wall biosynthesis
VNCLLFIESAEPGGAEQVVRLLAAGLREQGHAAPVLTLQHGWLTSALAQDGHEPVEVLHSRRRDPLLPLRIAARARRHRASLIHSHLLDSMFYGAIGARLAGVPHLGTDHGDIHLPEGKRRIQTKVRIAKLLGTRFTAVSGFTAQRLAGFGVPASRIVQFPNPIVVPPVPAPEERARARLALGVSGERDRHWVWVHAGMLRPVKDQMTLIRGFAAAAATARQVQTLFIAGEGPERPRLEALIRELGTGERVRLLGFRDDLDEILKAGDGFVLTSLSEALPMSLLEAAARGLYLVGTRAGGIPEIIEDGVTGRLFEPRDWSDLARVLSEVTQDTDRAKRIADGARARVVKTYEHSRVLAAYLEICRSLAAEGGPP